MAPALRRFGAGQRDQMGLSLAVQLALRPGSGLLMQAGQAPVPECLARVDDRVGGAMEQLGDSFVAVSFPGIQERMGTPNHARWLHRGSPSQAAAPLGRY